MLGCGSNSNFLTADRPNRTDNKLINATLQIQSPTQPGNTETGNDRNKSETPMWTEQTHEEHLLT